MKELDKLIEYINKNEYNKVKIEFDDQFGNEKQVNSLVNKLVSQGLVTIYFPNYTSIIVEKT